MPHVCRVDLTRVSVLRHVPKKQIRSQSLCSPESKYWKQIHWSAPRRASPRGAIAPSREQNEALCVCHPPEGMEEWCLVYPMWKLRNSICLSQWGTEMFIPFRTWRTCYSLIIWKLKKSYLIISIIFTQFCEETICLSNFESWGNDMSWKFRNSYVYPILTVEALTCLSLSENWGYFIPFWKGGTDTRIPFFQQSPEDPVKLYNPAVKSPNGFSSTGANPALDLNGFAPRCQDWQRTWWLDVVLRHGHVPWWYGRTGCWMGNLNQWKHLIVTIFHLLWEYVKYKNI